MGPATNSYLLVNYDSNTVRSCYLLTNMPGSKGKVTLQQ